VRVVHIDRRKVPGLVQTIRVTKIDPARFLLAPSVGVAIGGIPPDLSGQIQTGATLVRDRCALVSRTHLDLLDLEGPASLQ